MGGIRTIGFAPQTLDVRSYWDKDVMAKGYLLQYFSLDMAFVYEEGEPGSEDHFLEPMRKLKILYADEGDWSINRDTIRVLKENGLEKEFMGDLSNIVGMMCAKGKRIVDLQGVLGRDGHFYLADPLCLEDVPHKVNRYLLDGVFMNSENPKRNNKPQRAAFVDGLGVDLGVEVLDEDFTLPS